MEKIVSDLKARREAIMRLQQAISLEYDGGLIKAVLQDPRQS